MAVNPADMVGGSTAAGAALAHGAAVAAAAPALLLPLVNQVHLFDTRAQAIASAIPVGMPAIRVTRWATGYPLSNATYIPGTSSGPAAFRDAGGHWWQLDLTGDVISPHWFGARPFPFGTGAGSVVDCTAAIQAAIAACTATGGGTVQLGRGIYGIEALNISTSNVRIRGVGVNATTLLHICSVPSVAVKFSAGTAVLANCGISDLSICSAETTRAKTALHAGDVSEFTVDNVGVTHYPVDGSLYRGGGAGVALRTTGRELGSVHKFQAYAEVPLNIATNPNDATISLDSWTFTDFFGYCGPGTSGATVVIDSGVVLTNIVFNGAQNWIGGLHGLQWIDTTSAAISIGLYLYGVKSEQAGDPHGYSVYIQHNTSLYSFRMSDSMLGDRNGINLKNVKSAKLSNIFYDHGTAVAMGSDGYGLSVDSVDTQVMIDACTWTSGTQGSISGLTAKGTPLFVAGFSTQLPTSGVYTV